MSRDVDQLRRDLDTLIRTAAQLRAHIADLHSLGWESPVGDNTKVRKSTTDHAPRAGDPRARRLYDQTAADAAWAATEFVGLERAMKRLFFVGSMSPEPSRGSLIPAAEHAQLLANQRARPDTPTRLVDQPTHPGASR